MERPTTDKPTRIYQLKITLDRSEPPIWRRVLVPGSITLKGLHKVIQSVMDWDGGHPHVFTVDRTEIGPADLDLDSDDQDERLVRLDQIAKRAKRKFSYEYDFGDSWMHTIQVEQILPMDPGVKLPSCVGGERASPPEDCGGLWGYAGLLEVLADPEDPEHDEMMEYWSGPIDPEKFDLAVTNEALQKIAL